MSSVYKSDYTDLNGTISFGGGGGGGGGGNSAGRASQNSASRNRARGELTPCQRNVALGAVGGAIAGSRSAHPGGVAVGAIGGAIAGSGACFEEAR